MILFDVHEGLVSTLGSALTTPVFDSFITTDDWLPEAVVIGGALDTDEAGQTTTDWHDAPWGNRDDEGRVFVAVTVQSGDDTFTGLRARCGVIVDQILTAVQDDPSMGVTADRMDPQIQRIDIAHRCGNGSDGLFVEAQLTVHYRAINAY